MDNNIEKILFCFQTLRQWIQLLSSRLTKPIGGTEVLGPLSKNIILPPSQFMLLTIFGRS
jgi:hypothetical protein